MDPNLDAANGVRPDEDKLRKGLIRWGVREFFGVVIVALSLFWSAGTLNWGWGWALVGIYAGWSLANALIVGSRSPETLVERATRSKESPAWDLRIMSVVGILTLVKQVVAGLDYRLGWSGDIQAWLQVGAFILSALGYALGTWAMAVNAYFSMIVRMQRDRGHKVVRSGPYRFVRHPAYVGTVVFELLTPLMLGSWWALIPGVLSASLLVLRTYLEDRELQQNLAGYQEYTHEVCYRLIPGVW